MIRPLLIGASAAVALALWGGDEARVLCVVPIGAWWWMVKTGWKGGRET